MDFSLIGIPYDETQTLRKGASKAPDILRNIFHKMETYINGVDLTESFIEDLGNIKKEEFKKPKKFPIILGGEHTITKHCVKELKPETVVVFDAHPDCEDSDGHTGVVRRLIENGFNVILFGVRIISKKEQDFINENKIKIASLDELKNVKGPVYVSIDFDVLDPSIMRSVGNPEPSGLTFDQVIEGVKCLKNIIAVDFVEFTPENEFDEIMAGKLIYKIIAEIINVRK